jgi:phage-related minor tail protein
MANTTPPSGTDMASLGISVDTNAGDAASELDKLGTATVKVIKSIDDLSSATSKNAAWTADSNKQYENKIQMLERVWKEEQQLLKVEAEGIAVQGAYTDAQQKLIIKLEESIRVYGLTTEQIYKLRAAELGLAEAAAPLIAQLEALKAATAQYGAGITNLASIEEARIRFEQSALTAFNAFKIRTLEENRVAEETAMTILNAQRIRSINDNRAAEESAATALAAFKIRTMAENRAAAIKDIEEMEAIRLSAQEREKQNLTVFEAFKRRTLAENRTAAIAELEAMEIKAAALAEKQAIDEIRWNGLSVKTRIEQLELLKIYQANSAISPARIESTFGSAALADLANLVQLQEQYAASLAKTHSHTKAVTGATEELGVSLGNVRAKTELIVILHELLQGRFTRMAGSLMVLAEYTNAASVAMTGFGAATVAGAAAVGVIGYGMYQGIEQTKHFNDALNRTNGISGETTVSLTALADTVGKVHGQYKQAYEAATLLASSGRFTSDQLRDVTEAAVGLNHVFGTDLKASIKEFESLTVKGTSVAAAGTFQITKALEKLDEQYHFVTLSLMEEIIQLEKEGKAREASELALKAFTDESKRSTKAAEEYAGYIEHAWNGVTRAVRATIQAMADVGKASTLANQAQTLKNQLPKDSEGFVLTDQSRMTQTQIFQYKQLLAVQKEIADSEEAAIKRGKESETQSEGARIIAMRAIEERRLLKKTEDTLDNILKKEDQENDKLEEAHAGYKLENAKHLAERREALILEHTKKVAAIKNDGRKQDLLAALSADQSEFDQSKEHADEAVKLLKEQASNGLITRQQEFTQIGDIRRKELQELQVLEEAKLATLRAYEPLNEVDAKNKLKRLAEVEERYTLAAQKINGTLGLDQSSITDKAVKDVNKDSDKEIKDLITKIEKQHLFTAELGKTQAEKELAIKNQNDERTAQEEYQVEVLRTQLATDDLGTVERAVSEARLNGLLKAIELHKAYSEALQQGSIRAAEVAAIKEQEAEYKKLFNTIQTDLASAIVDGGGKGYKKLIKDMEVAFAKMILSPILQPISAGIAGAVTGGSGTGQQAAGSPLEQIMGSFSNSNQAYSNMYGSFAKSSYGQSLGLSQQAQNGSAVGLDESGNLTGGYADTYGASTLTDAGSAVGDAIPYLPAVAAAIQGKWGQAVGSAVGAYFGPLGSLVGSVIGSWVDSYFSGDGPETDTKLTFGSSANNVTSSTATGRHQTGGNYVGGAGVNTELGSYGVTDQWWIDAIATVNRPGLDKFLAAVKQSDNILASYMTVDEKTRVTSSLNNTVTQLSTGPEGSDPSKQYGTALTARIHQILDGVEGGLSRFIDSFTGTAEQLNAEAAAILAARAHIDSYTKVFGEAVTLDGMSALKQGSENLSVTITRLVSVFQITDAVALSLGKNVGIAFGSIGLSSDGVREKLVSMAGGLSALQNNASYFAQNFLTIQERMAPVQAQVAATLESINASSVTTINQFVDLVKSLNLTTESGQTAYIKLMVLAPAFKQVVDYMTSSAGATTALGGALATLKTAQDAYTVAVDAAKAAMNTAGAQYQAFADAVTTAQTNVTSAQDAILVQYQTAVAADVAAKKAIVDSQNAISNNYIAASDKVAVAQQKVVDGLTKMNVKLKDFLGTLDTTDLGGLSGKDQYVNLQSQFAIAVAQAKAGDSGAADSLPGIATNLLKASKDQSTTLVDYMRDVGLIKNAISDVTRNNDIKLNGAKPTAATPETELSLALVEQQKWAQAVVSSGASFTTSSGDILKGFKTASDVLGISSTLVATTTKDVLSGYKDASVAQQRTSEAVVYWTSIAQSTGVTLSTTTDAMRTLGNNLITQYFNALQALQKAEAEKIAADLIRAGQELKQTTALENFTKAISDVNKAATAAQTAAGEVVKAASVDLLKENEAARLAMVDAKAGMIFWGDVVTKTAAGIAASVKAMQDAKDATDAAKVRNDAAAAAAKIAADAAAAKATRDLVDSWYKTNSDSLVLHPDGKGDAEGIDYWTNQVNTLGATAAKAIFDGTAAAVVASTSSATLAENQRKAALAIAVIQNQAAADAAAKTSAAAATAAAVAAKAAADVAASTAVSAVNTTAGTATTISTVINTSAVTGGTTIANAIAASSAAAAVAITNAAAAAAVTASAAATVVAATIKAASDAAAVVRPVVTAPTVTTPTVTSPTVTGGVKSLLVNSWYENNDAAKSLHLDGKGDPEGIAYWNTQVASIGVDAAKTAFALSTAQVTGTEPQPIQSFATGAAFRNGVVSRPTRFNMGEMGENGDEAIMPLSNINGKLGVRASGNNQELNNLVRELINKIDKGQGEDRIGNSTIVSVQNKVLKVLQSVTQTGNAISTVSGT